MKKSRVGEERSVVQPGWFPGEFAPGKFWKLDLFVQHNSSFVPNQSEGKRREGGAKHLPVRRGASNTWTRS